MTRDITPAGWPATGAVDEAFAEVRASFDRFCLAAGIEALGTMMETDVTAACGPRHSRDAARRAHRWGRTRGRIGFHGGKIEVEGPRVRGVDGREVAIPALCCVATWRRRLKGAQCAVRACCLGGRLRAVGAARRRTRTSIGGPSDRADLHHRSNREDAAALQLPPARRKILRRLTHCRTPGKMSDHRREGRTGLDQEARPGRRGPPRYQLSCAPCRWTPVTLLQSPGDTSALL
jgi:hypothetical protein